MTPRQRVPLIYFGSAILLNVLISKCGGLNSDLYFIYTIIVCTATVALLDSCLEWIRYIHIILNVNEVKQRRNELLIGYVAVILWAMRSRYLLYYSGYNEEIVYWRQLNALIYAVSVYFFVWSIHGKPLLNTPHLAEFTETRCILVAVHFYVAGDAIKIGNWLQVFTWILSFASSQHLYEFLMSQSPEPAPAAPGTTPNIRDRLYGRERIIYEVMMDLGRNREEARAEVPDNQEEEENLGARIQAAWYPMGQSIREQNQRCFELLIHCFKTIADPVKIRNSVKKMEEKRRHRDQKNELLGIPNILKDDDFLDDLADVMAPPGMKRLICIMCFGTTRTFYCNHMICVRCVGRCPICRGKVY